MQTARFMRNCGTESTLKSFVVKCWEFAVADCLGEWLNWEGRKDSRIKIPGQPGPGKKKPIRNLLLTKVMLRKFFLFTFIYFLNKIFNFFFAGAIKSTQKYRSKTTVDEDFKKYTNKHLANSKGRLHNTV